jgi:endonuclease YncB( thermonuclease family)
MDLELTKLDPYVFKACVLRVIDGDSIKLDVSLGMGQWSLARKNPGSEEEAPYPQGVYRLNGIDTPEMNTAEGRAAKSRLEELLALSKTGDKVLIKTTKHGKFRYLADLYIETEAGTIHANQQLVDEGHAKPYRGGKKK